MLTESNRRFFNARAGEWNTRARNDAETLRMIVDRSGIEPGNAVLDIGCGTGIMLPPLRNAIGMRGTLIALDVAEEMLRFARLAHGVEADEYVATDFYSYRPSATFDAIMAYNCFPHFGPSDPFFRKAKGILSPGGRLIVAHGSGRDEINRTHTEGEEVERISSLLPPVAELARAADDRGFFATHAEETGSHYLLVCLVKP